MLSEILSFLKFSLFSAFGHEFVVLGDGLGIQVVEASLFRRVDGVHQLFSVTG